MKPCYLGSTNGRKGHLGSATLQLNSESDETAELPSLLNQVATMRNQGNSLEALVVGKGARSTAANNTGSTTVGLADHRKDNQQIATLEQKHKTLTTEIANLQASVLALRGSITTLQNQKSVGNATNGTETQAKKIKNLENQVVGLLSKIEECVTQQAEAQAEAQAQAQAQAQALAQAQTQTLALAQAQAQAQAKAQAPSEPKEDVLGKVVFIFG